MSGGDWCCGGPLRLMLGVSVCECYIMFSIVRDDLLLPSQLLVFLPPAQFWPDTRLGSVSRPERLSCETKFRPICHCEVLTRRQLKNAIFIDNLPKTSTVSSCHGGSPSSKEIKGSETKANSGGNLP